MRYAPSEPIFPSDAGDFTGFVIARFVVDEVTAGLRELAKDEIITLKGEMPSLSRGFRYLVRFKHDTGKRRKGTPASSVNTDGYELLPKTGFQDAKRLPWTVGTLTRALMYEAKTKMPAAEIRAAVKLLFSPGGVGVGEEVLNEEALQKAPFYKVLVASSDYYRLQKIILLRRGWPGKIVDIRKLETEVLEKLSQHIARAPHELCFYLHSKDYGLGEMPFLGLKDLLTEMGQSADGVPPSCRKLHIGSACFYNHMKESRARYGHTAFLRHEVLNRFSATASKQDGYGDIAMAACMWLVRAGHIVFVDVAGEEVHSSRWFTEEPCPIVDIQLIRDYRIKQRIAVHLKRIRDNFEASQGYFSMRDPDGPIVAPTGGACNAKQRQAVDHILSNWLTIVQGGPGSGKTFLGVKHLCSIVDWPHILTHVGRQAVALCDLLGGSRENARTIHSAHYSVKDNVFVKEYNEKKDILILDEVYNADDWTLEKALATCPEACRLVMVGDPDQIRPIPGDNGAGTPALDIARAFPGHVIFLEENMRQRDDARVIHSVVTAVRKKQPMAIEWGRDLERDAAVLLRPLPPGQQQTELIYTLIERLRRDISEPGGLGEHEWQLISFFNGHDPDKQGDGIIQLNEHVENYLDRSGFFRDENRPKFKISSRLTIYRGFKFMFGAKFTPDVKALAKGEKKDKKDKEGKESKSKKKKNDKEPPTVEYDEVCNGQIEVVKSVKQIKLHPSIAGKSPCWQVECYARSTRPGACGTLFLINTRLHVDPGRMFPAWAVTSNKSMGGECNNVGVYMPANAENVSFDRSNFYVAVSRPIRFLAVIGTQKDVVSMVMHDPPNIRSGLYMYLKHDDSRGWKQPAREKIPAALACEKALGGSALLYDQTGRELASYDTPVCRLPYSVFFWRAKEKRSPFKHDKEKLVAFNQEIIDRFNDRVAGVGERLRRKTDPPLLPIVDDDEEEEEEDEQVALASAAFAAGRFRPRPEEEEEEEEEQQQPLPSPLKRPKRRPLAIPTIVDLGEQ